MTDKDQEAFWHRFMKRARSVPHRDSGDEDVREQVDYNQQLRIHGVVVFDYVNRWWVLRGGPVPVELDDSVEAIAAFAENESMKGVA